MGHTPLFDRMRSEHQRLLGRIDGLAARITADVGLDAGVPGDAHALALELRDHLDREDEEVYASLARLLPEIAPQLADLRSERAELRGMLSAVCTLVGEAAGEERDEQIVVQASDLFELLRIHVRKEEALLFGLAGHALSPHDTPPWKGDPT